RATTGSAAPRAVPASPAAGWTQTCRYGPCAASRALATQLSATPPARVSTDGPPAASYSQRARSSSTSSSRACTLAARSACTEVQSSPWPRAVMRYKSDITRVEARERGGQEVRGVPGVLLAQPAPRVGQAQPVGRLAQPRIERVGHRVQLARGQPGVGQAPAGRLFGQLPGREGNGPFAVSASAEALLLGGGDDPPIDYQSGGGIMKNRVDAQDAHVAAVPDPAGSNPEMDVFPPAW